MEKESEQGGPLEVRLETLLQKIGALTIQNDSLRELCAAQAGKIKELIAANGKKSLSESRKKSAC